MENRIHRTEIQIYVSPFLIVIFLLMSISSYAQQIIAKQMPFLEQLPSNEVIDLHQDQNGFIWLGTKNGLGRYDGYQLQTFKSDFNQPHLLTDDFIWCFAEDDNYLLVGTRQGVNLVDKSNYQIRPFPDTEIQNTWINFMLVDSRKELWICTRNQVSHYNSDYSLKKRYGNLIPAVPNNGINSIYEDHFGNIWVCTWGGGLYKYLKNTDTFMSFPTLGANNNPFKIFQDKDDQYWILTWGDGIYRFHPDATEDRMYTHQEIFNEKLHQPETAFFSVVQDDVYGYIWIFGYHELYAFKVADGHLEKVDLSSYMFDYNKMFSQIIKDREGNLWAGAYDSGYHLLMGNPAIANNFLPKLKRHVGFDTNITTLGIDPNNGLWFNQERWGLCWYDIEQDKFYDYSNTNSGVHNIGYILRSKQPGEFWLGCRDQPTLYKAKLNSKREIEYLLAKDLYTPKGTTGNITSMYEDSKGNLWVATTGQLYLKPDSKDFIIPEFSLPNITSIAEDGHGNIWLATEDSGLHKVSLGDKLKPIKQYSTQNSSLPSNNIDKIVIQENHLWIATTQGSILQMDLNSEIMKDFSNSCGMTGQSILGMKHDRNTLWILTNRQLTAYDIQSDRYIHYSNSDESVQINSFKKDVIDLFNGKLYAGGHGGFVSMASSKFPSKKINSNPVIITDIKVSNNSFFFNPQRQSNDLSTRSIWLEPEDNNLEIFFSALQFTATSRIRYAYKMDGVDKEWVYTETGNRSAFYNKIPKGYHTFKVRSTDEYGYWKDDVTELRIYKKPAWYETWWAYGTYITLIILILYSIMFYYLHRIRRSDQVRFQKELTKTKLEYFTHISHELLTPLTTISCVADDLEETKASPQEDVHILKSNVLRLKRLIQQVLDFRKVENDSFVLTPTYGNISSFIREIYHTGIRPIIEKKNLHFSLHLEEKDIWGYMDFDKIDKVLYNILSNAAKYTPADKKVELNVSTLQKDNSRFLRIEVQDEGIGIDQKEISKIFTPFYVNKTAYAPQSNGVGLSLTKKLVTLHKGDIQVESSIGEGSRFTVLIPIDRNYYPEIKDIIETSEIPSTVPNETTEDTEEKEDTILLVDDNEEFLLLMKRKLATHYNILTATNGKKALEIVRSEDVGLMVSDYMMPEMDGIELCATMKQDINTSHIPVLMLTAKSSVEDQVRCFNAGANGYLTKPFDMKMLNARIDNLMKSNQKRQEKFRVDTEINVVALEYQSTDEQFLEKAIECIEQHLIETEFDIDTFASELNVSKSTLNRKMKAMTGLSPVEFIRNIRLKHACTLLKKPFINVSEVAYAVGFSNPKYFTKCFKKEFDVTPTEYQKKEEDK